MKTQITYNGRPIIVEHRGGQIKDVRDTEGNFVSIDTNEQQSVMEKVRENE